MNINLKMLIGVIIGILLLFTLPYIIEDTFGIGSVFAIMLATIYVGYATGGNYRNGAFNGVIVGIILAIIYFITAYYFSGTVIGVSLVMLVLTLLYIIITFAIFGAVGGLIGILIKGRITSTENTAESMGYLICDKCGGYYELLPGESPEDYEECECGGKLRYSTSLSSNKSEDLNYDKYEIIDDKNKLISFINFKNKKF